MSSYVGAEAEGLHQLARACAEAEDEVGRARAEVAEALALGGLADDVGACLREVEDWLRRERTDLLRRARSLEGGDERGGRGRWDRRRWSWGGGWWERSWSTRPPGGRVGESVVDVWAPPRPLRVTSSSVAPGGAAKYEAWPLPRELLVVESRRSYGRFPDSLERVPPKTGRPRFRDRKTGRFYEWDPSHGGELEGYNKRGRHIGVFDPETGERVKDPVEGRKSPP